MYGPFLAVRVTRPTRWTAEFSKKKKKKKKKKKLRPQSQGGRSVTVKEFQVRRCHRTRGPLAPTPWTPSHSILGPPTVSALSE